MRVLLLSLCLIAAHFTKGQIFVQPSYLKPSLEFGYIYKPSLGLEVGYVASDPDDMLQARVGIAYNTFTMRRDTFPAFAYGSFGNGKSFVPGFAVYGKGHFFGLNFSAERSLFTSNFSPFVGMESGLFGVSYDLYSEIRGISQTTEEVSYLGFFLMPKLGFSYLLNDTWIYSLGFGKGMGFTEEWQYFSWWKGYLSVSYFFN